MTPVEPRVYIDGKTENGLVYDFRKIKSEYEKLNCPPEYRDPSSLPLAYAKLFVDISDRSTGKTTNWILLAMCMYKLYGTNAIYIRQRDDMIAPKNTINLFAVILEHDYISTLFDGQWNSVFYKSRRWYLCRRDEAGDIEEVDDTYFMFMCSVLKATDLKSGFNAPFGDFLIFDEFISKDYYPSEFILFCDLVKTIIRDRQSPIVVMLANTIDKHSQYFNELEIYEEIQTMSQGDSRLITTDLGTKIHVEILGMNAKKQKKRSIVNKLFFGFKSPELASVTGYDWAQKNYQHIPDTTKEDNSVVIYNHVYILHNERLIRLDFVHHDELGFCIYVHWATKTHPDSIILTSNQRHDSRYCFGFGPARLQKIITKCLQERRFYYASNDVGSFFSNYYNYIKKFDLLT